MDTEQIRLRAYFHFVNETGTCWWDPVSNWLQAEREQLAERASREKRGVIIETDFVADLCSELGERLRSEGYDVPTGDAEKIISWWFSTRYRMIPRRRRSVRRSREIKTQQLTPGESAALRRIESFSQEGRNLNPFLSRRRLSADFTDVLFSSWKIAHLHLGTPDGSKVPGTSRLLFARIDKETMYFVAVRDHSSFSEQDLLRIVQENWPELNEHGRLIGAVGVSQTLSDTDVSALRAAGINTISEVAGAVLGPVGGGITTARTSASATRSAIQLQREVELAEEEFRKTVRGSTRLRLLVAGDKIRIVDAMSGMILREWPIQL